MHPRISSKACEHRCALAGSLSSACGLTPLWRATPRESGVVPPGVTGTGAGRGLRPNPKATSTRPSLLNKRGGPWPRLWLVALACVIAAPWAGAQTVTQSLTLRPGWNSVWLEVQPTDNSVEAVFGGLPLESVWTYQARLSAVQFIEDPAEPVWNRSSWRVFVPTNRFESFQNNLFTVQAHRPYLVHITNSAPLTWSVTGRPSVRSLEWVADSLNLVGFPVDPGLAPTFSDYFRSSTAQTDPATGKPRKIYRLQPSGAWVLANDNETMERGVAYWVYSAGASAFTGPVDLGPTQGDGLDYGGSLSQVTLRLRNLEGTPRVVTLSDQAVPSLLSYYQFSTNNADTWPGLPPNFNVSLPGGTTRDLQLAVRRQAFVSAEYASILEIRSDDGVLYQLPVTARTSAGLATVLGQSPAEEARGHAGLWVGTVTLNAVAEVNSGVVETNPVTHAVSRTGVSAATTPTRSELNFRILLHVDTHGVTRLLKDVIQMWRDGTYTNDPSGLQRTAEAGRVVLLTDTRLLTQFRGIALRDGVAVGRRISTLGYDFYGGTNNTLELSGLFAISQQLTGTLDLPSTAPTNPFRHKYHPDHDNMDATFKNFSQEAYPITREIELEFTDTDPSGQVSPEYGYNVMAGLYREQITGLHKDPIHVSGIFRLQRVALTGVLDQ